MERIPSLGQHHFAQRLAEWRSANRLSCAEAARRADVSHRTWVLWERGSRPRMRAIPVLAGVLGLPTETLMGWLHGEVCSSAYTEGTPAAAIREWRAREALSLARSARRLGVAPSTVREWEHGQRPRAAHLALLRASGVLPYAIADGQADREVERSSRPQLLVRPGPVI